MPEHGYQKSLDNLSIERHGYSDSNPKVSISEINFKHDKSELIQGLGEFFYREYRNELPDRHGRKRAFDKAESLVEGNFDNRDILGDFNYQEGFHKALKQAISHGYIWKIEIEKPWHPKFFFNTDGVKTFPSQHNEVILWTAQHTHRFFTGPGKVDILRSKYDFEDFNNPESVLEQNCILIGSRFNHKNKGTGAEAVYFAHYLHHLDSPRRDKSATHYAAQKYVEGLYEESPVLEFRIPSDLIYVHKVPGSRDSDEGVCKNLAQTKSKFESPLNLLEKAKTVEYQYRHEKLFLDLCTGIWHSDNYSNINPNFESVQKFHKQLFHQYPFRVPWNTNLTNQKLGKTEAEQVRKKKVKSEGYYQTIEYAEDILQNSEEISKIANSLVVGLDIPYVNYQGDSFPIICSTCGDIFQDSLCNNCGHDLEEDVQNPFIIEKSIQSKKKELLEYKNIFSQPLEWEYKVKDLWEMKGQKYKAPKFWITDSTTVIIDEFENFEKKLIEYSSGLIKLISEFDGNRELQKRAERIKQDIEKTERDIKSIESIKN